MLPPPDLAPVQHEVVGLRQHAAGVLFHQVHVGLDGRGERVVHRRPPALLAVPLEQREVRDPRERELAGLEPPFRARDREPELAEHLRRGVGRAAREQQQVGPAGARRVQGGAQRRVSGGLESRALHGVAALPDPHEAARAQRLRLDRQRVEFLAR